MDMTLSSTLLVTDYYVPILVHWQHIGTKPSMRGSLFEGPLFEGFALGDAKLYMYMYYITICPSCFFNCLIFI